MARSPTTQRRADAALARSYWICPWYITSDQRPEPELSKLVDGALLRTPAWALRRFLFSWKEAEQYRASHTAVDQSIGAKYGDFTVAEKSQQAVVLEGSGAPRPSNARTHAP